MKFEITDDNQPYLDARGKIILNACPGSGKTSAISYKLTTLTKECEEAFGNYSGIACLSFTNVAKNEIGEKFRLISGNTLSYPNLISTIDSFINQFITLPFYYLLEVGSKRPNILNTVAFLDDMNLGYFPNLRKQPLKVSYPPSKIKIEINGSYSWDGHKPNSAIVNLDVFERYADKFKKWQITNGYLNNDDSTYIAWHLLKKYPSIAKNLVQRFPYIIIDEAQDTSEIQYKIFDELVKAGLNNMEYVGDPYQSLYEFREARPDLFIERFKDGTNWTPHRLNSCRRSSQNIVNAYSLFRNAEELPIISACKHDTDHRLKVIRYSETDLPQLIGKFEALIDPSLSNYILVRGGTHLEQFGVKRGSENPWKNDIAKTLIEAEIHLSEGNTKACIDTLREFLISIKIPDADYKTKKNEASALKEDINTNIKLFDFVRNMPSIDNSIISWNNDITAYIKEKLNIDVDLQLKQKKGKPYYDQNLKELLYPKVSVPYPISTIHKVKGMTFSSVLLVLSNNSAGEKISLSDFVRPAEMPSEKQRMIYVAMSRPEVLSCIAVPNSFSQQQIREALGDNLDFEGEDELNLF
jgi:DNA helicase-2/ATP-dependent DNA helicase PcrA